jgi:glycosyltransferase involved in cell wall biosynthesis
MSDHFLAVHVIPSLHPGWGGPSRTVVSLTDALAIVGGARVVLVSQGRAGEPAVASLNAAVDRQVLESRSSVGLKSGWPIRRQLLQLARMGIPDIVHNHGVWLPVNHWAASFARHQGSVLVTHPRGMLEPWAFSHKGWKKRIAMNLYQWRDLVTARVLIATAEREFLNLRALGLTQPIAVIPNGVKVGMSCPGDAAIAHDQNRQRTILFLSRVHKIKGLLNLVSAWAKLKPTGWRLLIAGPDEGGHVADVMAFVRDNSIGKSVSYLGEVDGEEKAAAYRSADIFVLPTFSENFGVVVAEALSHGLPVITTKGAPWADLETYGCGWWVEIGVEPLAVALREAMALSDEERRAMGDRGRTYVRRYCWDDIARQMAEVYRWVLGRGAKPDCVYSD